MGTLPKFGAALSCHLEQAPSFDNILAVHGLKVHSHLVVLRTPKVESSNTMLAI
jgi:hypothetical protein